MNRIQCPKCRKTLPQIGSGELQAGERVQCGLCHHVWVFRGVRVERHTCECGLEATHQVNGSAWECSRCHELNRLYLEWRKPSPKPDAFRVPHSALRSDEELFH